MNPCSEYPRFLEMFTDRRLMRSALKAKEDERAWCVVEYEAVFH